MFILMIWATPVLPDVHVSFRDGNPHDRFFIHNASCANLTGILTIDLRNSANGVLIDTIRGGPGTKDPMPVAVERGNIKLAPVADGDQELVVYLAGMQPGEQAVVTLDLDDTAGWLSAPRVSVDGHEVEGALVTLNAPTGASYGTFGKNGVAYLPDPVKITCPKETPVPRADGDLVS